MSEFHTEQSVADNLGVPREQIAQVRKSELYEKEHWIRRGREIVITQLGIDKLISLIGSKIGAPSKDGGATGPGQKKHAPANPPANAGEYTGRLQNALNEKLNQGYVIAKITKVFLGKRIMFGQFEGKQIRIVVRDSKNFVPGMEVPVKHAHDEVFTFEGRLPNRRGRLIR